MTNYFNDTVTSILHSTSDFDLPSTRNPFNSPVDRVNLPGAPKIATLELIEPYDALSVNERKDVVRRRYVDDQSGHSGPLWSFDIPYGICTLTDELLAAHSSRDITIGDKIAKDCNSGDSHLLTKRSVPTIVEPSKNTNKRKAIKENVAHNDPPRSRRARPLQQSSDEQIDFSKNSNACNCSKSKCLRLYCECFAKGLQCGPQCNCTGCHNNDQHRVLRDLVVQETLEKNPSAFKSKFKVHARKQNILHSRGCNCSKTNCLKEYCECFKAGTGCSRLCRCLNCKNAKIEIAEEEVVVYHDKVMRKRRRKSVMSTCLVNEEEMRKVLGNALPQ